MPFTNAGKAIMLDHMRGEITEISLHNGDPGTTGANEISGGGYARAAVVEADWDAASAGSVSLNNAQAFDGTGGQAVTHAGIWVGATFVGESTLSGDSSFNSSGEYTVTAGSTFDLNG